MAKKQKVTDLDMTQLTRGKNIFKKIRKQKKLAISDMKPILKNVIVLPQV